MARGLRAFDKIDASELFDRTWLEFAPAGDGVGLVLRVKEARPNRAELGLGYTEWEKARGSIRLRNQNTLGFGEQLELLLAASDAERFVQASLRGDRLLLTGLRLPRDRATPTATSRASSTRKATRSTGRASIGTASTLALRSSLERWGLVEAGPGFGRVRTRAEAGIDLPGRRPGWRALRPRCSTPSTTSRGPSTAAGSRSRASGASPAWAPTASTGGLRRSAAAARSAGGSAQLDAQAGFSGDDLPVYDWYRMGGVALLPGYRHEELKGAQAFRGA